MQHPFLHPPKGPRVLAHQGFVSTQAAAEGIVENTAAAFDAAIKLGVTTIESDCHVSKDGHVVLIHDADLKQVLGDPTRVDAVTKVELEARFADRGGIVTLAEALERFPEARFNIDVKVFDAAEGAGRAAAPHADRVLLTSFSQKNRLASLEAARRAGARMRPATSPGSQIIVQLLGALALRSRTLTARALRGLDALQIPERQGPFRVLTPRLLRAAHDHGVEVHVWTVNDEHRMRELVALGVDGLVTDRSDLAVKAFPGRG